MFYVDSKTDTGAYIKDTEDGVLEFFTFEEIEKIVFEENIPVSGVLHDYDGSLYIDTVFCRHNVKYTTEFFKLLIWNCAGADYTLISEYKNVKTAIRLRHNCCGREFTMMPNKFLGGQRCIHCNKTERLTMDEFKSRISPEVEVLSKQYKSMYSSMKFRHKNCGTEYFAEPRALVYNHLVCPYCSRLGKRSLPEYIIASHIEKYFKCEFSYRPSWLALNSTHNYGEVDIWIPEKNIGIEFDGAFHADDYIYEKDLRKNQIFDKKGFTLYRLRVSELEYYPIKRDTTFEFEKVFNLKAGHNLKVFETTVNKLCYALNIPEIKVTPQFIEDSLKILSSSIEKNRTER